ncbi:MAG: hypothetical protein Q9214_007858, partial [Letrouitia sp. 1 TL-2023]
TFETPYCPCHTVEMEHMKEKDAMAKTQQKVTFLGLPRELRDMIYEECFPKAFSIGIYEFAFSPINPSNIYPVRSKIPGINLLRTCKQLYTEAATVLYGRDLFMFLDPTLWNVFNHFQENLKHGREHLRHLRIMYLDYSRLGVPVVEGLKLVKKLPRIQTVDFITQQRLQTYDGCKHLLYRFVRDGFRFEMFFGFTHIDFSLGFVDFYLGHILERSDFYMERYLEYTVVRQQPPDWSVRRRFEDFASHRAQYEDELLLVVIDAALKQDLKNFSDRHNRSLLNVEDEMVFKSTDIVH